MGTLDAFRVTGKVAVVTGGSRGLGLEIAQALAEGGARVVLAARDEEVLKAAAAKIAGDYSVDTAYCAGDVAVEETAERIVRTAIERFGRLDILVNNAGTNVRGPIDRVTPADFDQVMGLNLKGAWLLCRAASATLKLLGSGRVINVASSLGLIGMADRSLYCSSKGGLVQLTRELAMEWAPWAITVNAICPGPFETDMNKSLVADRKLYEEFANKTALKRWGRPGEIGPAALFLASPAASYVTGAILSIDGGWTAY